MIADGVGDVGSAVVILAGVVVAVGTLWRMVLRPIGQRVTTLAHLVEREMTPNGGASLRDQIDGLRADVEAHARAEAEAVAEMRARLDALNVAVEAMTAWARSHDHMHDHLGDDHR